MKGAGAVYRSQALLLIAVPAPTKYEVKRWEEFLMP
jgi:hypothetical protein